MADQISHGGLSDSLAYLLFGDGCTETFEPFCEASLMEPYPHNSLEDARTLLGSAGRVQLVSTNARHSTWIVDQVIRVRGWSEEVVKANSAIWSKRLATANITWITSAITTIGASIYAFVGTEIGTVAVKTFGDAMAQQVARTAFATLGWNHVALLALIVGAAALWCLSSRRYSEAESQLSKTEQTAAQSVADFRDSALRGDFYRAVEHRGLPGQVTSNGFIAPQETQWLWMERICQESAKFDNPLLITGGELTLAFTRKNPFDVMDQALEGSSILAKLSDVKTSYLPLAAQLRQIQQLYDMRGQDIRDLAEKNRELIRERRRAAFNVVDGIYWTKVDAAREERDRSLRSYQISTRGLSLEEAREAERLYNNDSRVIAVKNRYRDKVRDYDNYRTLAHAAIRGWFNPQIQKEYDKEAADLKANYQTNLNHLSGYYPTVRALYRSTARALEMQGIDATPADTEMSAAALTLPHVAAPVLPAMQTAMPPAEPPSSEMRSWARAGGGLGLDFFLTCAAAGVGFYAAYKANSSTYEQVIADHQNDESATPPRYEEPTPPPPYAPSFYAQPVEPSTPFYDPDPSFAPPSYDEVMRGPQPSAPFYDLDPPLVPPSYDEVTRSPQPSAPPADLVFGRV